MAILMSHLGLIKKEYQGRVVKHWSYPVNLDNIKQTAVTKHVVCVYFDTAVHNEDLEFQYLSFLNSNNQDLPFDVTVDADLKIQMKYEEWVSKNYIPVSCMPEAFDEKLGVHRVRFLTGDTLLIPHIVCPQLLDTKLDEISLIFLKESFCEKYNLL